MCNVDACNDAAANAYQWNTRWVARRTCVDNGHRWQPRLIDDATTFRTLASWRVKLVTGTNKTTTMDAVDEVTWRPCRHQWRDIGIRTVDETIHVNSPQAVKPSLQTNLMTMGYRVDKRRAKQHPQKFQALSLLALRQRQQPGRKPRKIILRFVASIPRSFSNCRPGQSTVKPTKHSN